MSTKKYPLSILFVFLAVSVTFFSCQSYSDGSKERPVAQVLPDGYSFPISATMQNFTVKYDDNHQPIESPDLLQFLQTQIGGIEVVDTQADGDGWEPPSEVLVGKIVSTPKKIGADALTGKNYFVRGGQIGLNVGVSVSANAKLTNLVEINFIQYQNPEYALSYVVDPSDLLRRQLDIQQSKDKNGMPYVDHVFFALDVLAPGHLVVSQAVEGGGDISGSITIGGNGAGGEVGRTYQSENSTTYDNNFALRKYSNPGLVKQILAEKVPMFVEVSGDAKVTNGPGPVDPLGVTLLGDDGKKYTISPLYAQHLEAEGVHFHLPTLTEVFPPTLPVEAADELRDGSASVPYSDSTLGIAGIRARDGAPYFHWVSFRPTWDTTQVPLTIEYDVYNYVGSSPCCPNTTYGPIQVANKIQAGQRTGIIGGSDGHLLKIVIRLVDLDSDHPVKNNYVLQYRTAVAGPGDKQSGVQFGQWVGEGGWSGYLDGDTENHWICAIEARIVHK